MIPVVIPYYKGRKKLRKCRKHLKAQTMNGELEIHVVNDNRRASGYTVAVNRGLRYYLVRPSQWDYIVVLDQDMYLDPDAIEELKKLMDSHPECGVAVALQRLYDRPVFVQGGGHECLPVGVVEEAHRTNFTKDTPAFWGDIACCMIRKECLWDTGLLDENFGFVCSDSDFTMTARTKGWEVWIACNALGIHERGDAAPKDMEKKSEKCLKQIGKDIFLFKRKWANSDYYKLLKYEKGKPIFIIKSGKVWSSGEKSRMKKQESLEIWKEILNVDG